MKRSLFGAGEGGGKQHVVISGSYISETQSVFNVFDFIRFIHMKSNQEISQRKKNNIFTILKN